MFCFDNFLNAMSGIIIDYMYIYGGSLILHRLGRILRPDNVLCLTGTYPIVDLEKFVGIILMLQFLVTRSGFKTGVRNGASRRRWVPTPTLTVVTWGALSNCPRQPHYLDHHILCHSLALG